MLVFSKKSEIRNLNSYDLVAKFGDNPAICQQAILPPNN